MPPARTPSLWEHATLELRVIPSGKKYFIKGRDGAGKLIDCKVSHQVESVDILISKVDIGLEDANAMVAAIRSHGAFSQPQNISSAPSHFSFVCAATLLFCLWSRRNGRRKITNAGGLQSSTTSRERLCTAR